MVVWNTFYFQPYLVKWSNLTNILGLNRHLVDLPRSWGKVRKKHHPHWWPHFDFFQILLSNIFSKFLDSKSNVFWIGCFRKLDLLSGSLGLDLKSVVHWDHSWYTKNRLQQKCWPKALRMLCGMMRSMPRYLVLYKFILCYVCLEKSNLEVAEENHSRPPILYPKGWSNMV